jgi:Cytochrome c7 and related cytochrome c
MPLRTRTTKGLAKRIDLQYFTRPHPFRTWRRILAIALPLLLVTWVFASRLSAGPKVFSKGPLSHGHAAFSSQCQLCHVQAAGFRQTVNDSACQACHHTPAHHANMQFTPSCASCHIEHRGEVRLTATSVDSCTQCHADLHTTSGVTRYVAHIRSLSNGHPDLVALRSPSTVPEQVKFNHHLHLQPNLKDRDGQPTQLACKDCHNLAPDRAGTTSARPGSYMASISYTQHCARCHTLQFAPAFGEQQVPHAQPAVIHADLVQRFTQMAQQGVHLRQSAMRTPLLPLNFPQSSAKPAGIDAQVQQAETILWKKTCRQCHAVEVRPAALPVVSRTQTVSRWMTHARFNHSAHTMLTCVACHSEVASSRDDAKPLLPSITVCQQCHGAPSSARFSADGRCSECHDYHGGPEAPAKPSERTVALLH